MDLEQKAIERIRYAEQVSMQLYGLPPIVSYSGGKDSDVLLELTKRAGINFEVQHSHTTADAPETVYYVRDVFSRLEDEGIKCHIHMPHYKGKRTTMWELIELKLFPPTRNQRYCCEVIKENGVTRRVALTGVRWAESKRRTNTRGALEHNTGRAASSIVFMDDNTDTRRQFEMCKLKNRATINPILEWPDYDTWQFSRTEVPCQNPFYEKTGLCRCGCIGCPVASKARSTEFRLYPKFEQAYRRAFAKMLERRKAEKPCSPLMWETADEVFDFWMEDKNVEGQINFDEYLTENKAVQNEEAI